MIENKNITSNCDSGNQTSLLFFFLILVILFQGPCNFLFESNDSLLFFFLLLVILFCYPIYIY